MNNKLRRSALLATASAPGGDKIINYIILHPRTTGTIFKTLCIDYEFQYPASSQIYMNISYPGTSRSTGLNIEPNVSNGTAIDVDIDPPSRGIELISIDPQEDSKYVYKPFSTYLISNFEGEFGKNFYQYLLSLPKDDVGEVNLPFEITIDNTSYTCNYKMAMYQEYQKTFVFGYEYYLNENGEIRTLSPFPH